MISLVILFWYKQFHRERENTLARVNIYKVSQQEMSLYWKGTIIRGGGQVRRQGGYIMRSFKTGGPFGQVYNSQLIWYLLIKKAPPLGIVWNIYWYYKVPEIPRYFCVIVKHISTGSAALANSERNNPSQLQRRGWSADSSDCLVPQLGSGSSPGYTSSIELCLDRATSRQA